MKQILPLRDIAKITTGYPFRKRVEDDLSGEVRVIQMRDTTPPDSVAWRDTIRVVMEKNIEHYLLHNDDILFVMQGGRYYAIHVGTVPYQAVVSPHFFRIRVVKPQLIEPAFLAWQLNQSQAQRYYSSVEAGSSQKSLRIVDFIELPIVLPALERQHKILHAVNCIYKDIALLQAGITNRETLLTAIATKELI